MCLYKINDFFECVKILKWQEFTIVNYFNTLKLMCFLLDINVP